MKRILGCLALCLAAASCKNTVPVPAPSAEQGVPALHSAEFRISNGSFEEPLAYVAISIDDEEVFSGGLHVARQHNHFRFQTSRLKRPSTVAVATTPGQPPPEGHTSKRRITVEQTKALRFDVEVHGTNIFIHQVERFVPST
ncbi:MAG: hypothetical protein WCN95_15320 [bacterium]